MGLCLPSALRLDPLRLMPFAAVHREAGGGTLVAIVRPRLDTYCGAQVASSVTHREVDPGGSFVYPGFRPGSTSVGVVTVPYGGCAQRQVRPELVGVASGPWCILVCLYICVCCCISPCFGRSSLRSGTLERPCSALRGASLRECAGVRILSHIAYFSRMWTL